MLRLSEPENAGGAAPLPRFVCVLPAELLATLYEPWALLMTSSGPLNWLLLDP